MVLDSSRDKTFMSDTLSAQLSRKVAAFLTATGLTHKQLARLIGCDRSQLTSYLSTGTGISAERALKLVQVLGASRSQLEAKFGRTAVSSQIVSLQERGKVMKLDSSGAWVSGQSGQDPNGTDDITGVKTARDLDNSDDYQARITAFLKDQQAIYRQAIAHIDNYLTNVQKAKVNRAGNTEPARTVNTNDKSSHPGSRGDLFSITSRQHLEYLQRQRAKAEEELAIQKAILAERKKELAARMELAQVKEKTVFSA
jgi:transcriptional regulator with XRE-family HTH domain